MGSQVHTASIGGGSDVSFVLMDNHTQRIVNKAWSYAHVLRDAGVPFHSYTQQITYLLFLKMADERTKPLSLQGGISFGAWKLKVQSCAKALPSSG